MEKVKILILDDEADMADTISEMLSFVIDELETSLAYNAHDAFDLVSNNNYDCIISDINLPGLDGPSFVKELNKKGIKTPVVFMSGQTEFEIQKVAKEIGVDKFIPKPFDITSISDVILSCVKQAS